jgi:hypothetical protein
MSAVTLRAADLYSKWGFGDGDILRDAFDDMNLGGIELEHETLCLLVEDKLLPILPRPVKTDRIGSIHNPIRVDDDHLKDGSLEANAACAVTVTYEEIRRYAEKGGTA